MISDNYGLDGELCGLYVLLLLCEGLLVIAQIVKREDIGGQVSLKYRFGS